MAWESKEQEHQLENYIRNIGQVFSIVFAGIEMKGVFFLKHYQQRGVCTREKYCSLAVYLYGLKTNNNSPTKQSCNVMNIEILAEMNSPIYAKVLGSICITVLKYFH